MRDDWDIRWTDWDPGDQPLREALCATGNGNFVTRGAFAEVEAGGPHYPGTYLAGGYDRIETEIAGRRIENEDLVNWPNWLSLSFRPGDGEWLHPDRIEILDFEQILHLREGTLERRMRFRDRDGRETVLRARRLVHMGEPSRAALEWCLTPKNWSGPVEVRSALDGRVENAGVARYSELRGDHLEPLETGRIGEDGIELVVRTRQSHIVMAQAARTRVFHGEVPLAVERRYMEEEAFVAHHLSFECEREQPVRIEKVVALVTSRDRAIGSPRLEATKQIHRARGFDSLAESHERAWRRLWDRCDIELGEAGEHSRAQRILRLHVFHLLQTVSRHSMDHDVGVPARGWHGEAYRGHVFWDELFIFPFLELRFPELTRALLMYRFRRLPEARWSASEAGHRGAMYPWQSGSDGREESQQLHLNPESGRWNPDETYLQRHVGAAIAHNVWTYFQATGDREFLSFYGAEMLLEIADFLSGLATLDADSGRYGIRGVVGPDEFHTRYPGSDEPGLDNNAYTNVMTCWVLARALECLELLETDRRRELLEELAISDDVLARWDEVSRKLVVPIRDDGVILQFEGWDELEELDWAAYRDRYEDIRRLDRILEAEDDDVNRYKAAKQADVLMLFYLFSTERLTQLFDRLGYELREGMIERNVEHYLQRTAHGSTLSSMVHSWVLSRLDREASWEFFEQALRSDVDDVQGGTTAEGIHLGAMAGTVDLVQRCYTGVRIRDDVLWIEPRLPEPLTCIRHTLHYRDHWLDVEVRDERLKVAFRRGWQPAVDVGFHGRVYTFREGDRKIFDLRTGKTVEEETGGT